MTEPVPVIGPADDYEGLRAVPDNFEGVRIVSDGTLLNSALYVDGVAVNDVYAIEWRFDVLDGIGRAVIHTGVTSGDMAAETFIDAITSKLVVVLAAAVLRGDDAARRKAAQRVLRRLGYEESVLDEFA